jgi:hypothetical protein
MTSRDFCYWLQGLFELGDPESLTPEQIQTIRNHLNMVFYHEIDPSFGGPEVQGALNEIHSGSSVPVPPTNPAQRPPGNDLIMRC